MREAWREVGKLVRDSWKSGKSSHRKHFRLCIVQISTGVHLLITAFAPKGTQHGSNVELLQFRSRHQSDAQH